MQTSPETRARAAGTGGYLVIDLDALAANYRYLSGRAAQALTGAVVKADAYGLGAFQVSTALYAAACRHFFVAQACEAFSLRPSLPADAALYVLNGLPEGAETTCADQNIIPVLNSPHQIARWANLAKARRQRLPAVVQFDTGMARLGLSPEEARALTAAPEHLAALDIHFIMSHLACADTPDNAANAVQLAHMREISALFPGLPVSLANSGGLFLGDGFLQHLTRPGIALYGGAPNDAGPNPMQAVVSLHVAVIQTRTVPAGTLIGYGGTYTAPRDMRLATLGAGYADGLPRSLSPRGAAWHGDIRLPIVGRISMDSLMVDITDLPPGALDEGDFVELIGPHQSIDTIAADAGTISYEILTALGRRFYREYRREYRG
ncbi:alanine racemase [Asticcacaulis taihuensis]|uniref:alanine racemase n=1 Tax=Asticcacaulis taihuensis TaxID=260084 RepID=UPI003F7C2CB9